MNDFATANSSDSSKETTSGLTAPTPLRVVLVADDQALRCYGPVLRRMAVGLLDEVSDLSVLSLGQSPLLRHIPSPPVRVITETKHYRQIPPKFDITARQTSISAPPIGLFDKIVPKQRILRIAETLSRYKPVLLHALSERQFQLTRDLSKQLEIDYIVSILGLKPRETVFSDPNCGGLLCCHSRQTRLIRLKKSFPADRVHILPIGTHVAAEPCCFSHERKISNLFCCSKLEKNRGLSSLINVIQALTENGRQLRLFISGQGSAEYKLRKQVAMLKLQSQIHFVPPIEQMVSASDAFKALFRDTDIFIQPWRSEHWQPELLEAMSVGNAVIVTESPGNDLIIDGQTASVVPFQDESALKRTLNRMLQDHDYARILAKNAQQHLRKHFLASRMISRLAKAYQQVVNPDKS